MPKIKKPQHHSMELQFHPKAEMAIEYFSPSLQEKILKVIEVLQQEGIKPPRLQIHKLKGLNKVFMTKVNIDLRILFSLERNTLTILDVLTLEKLLRLRSLFTHRG